MTTTAALTPVQCLRGLIFDAKEMGKNGFMEVNGHTFAVSAHIVNRKCYDNEPTPTLLIKVDGKRISYDKAVALLTTTNA